MSCDSNIIAVNHFLECKVEIVFLGFLVPDIHVVSATAVEVVPKKYTVRLRMLKKFIFLEM